MEVDWTCQGGMLGMIELEAALDQSITITGQDLCIQRIQILRKEREFKEGEGWQGRRGKGLERRLRSGGTSEEVCLSKEGIRHPACVVDRAEIRDLTALIEGFSLVPIRDRIGVGGR